MTEYKFCKDTAVVCQFHKKGEPCTQCVDITGATKFLLKKIKPKSGKLDGVIANMDYVAFLMEEYKQTKL